MKMIKNSILALSLVLAGLISAQSVGMTNMLKVGINGGVALPKGNASASLGADVSYQYLVTPSFGLGVATGYNHFFAKDDNNDFGVVPAAVLLRYYPKKTGFYAGADLGYGFIVGNDKVNSNFAVTRPDGGFYLKPELGYHNRDWNFFIHYTKIFTGNKGKLESQDYNAGSLGVGIAYNIPLGK